MLNGKISWEEDGTWQPWTQCLDPGIVGGGSSSSRQRGDWSDLLSYSPKLFGEQLVTVIELIIICRGGGERRRTGKGEVAADTWFQEQIHSRDLGTTSLQHNIEPSWELQAFEAALSPQLFLVSSLGGFLIDSSTSPIKYGHATLWLKKVHSSDPLKDTKWKQICWESKKHLLPRAEPWMILHSSTEQFFLKISQQMRPCHRSLYDPCALPYLLQ